MAKKEIRNNTPLNSDELAKKIESDLMEQGVVSQTVEEDLRTKVQDTFDYYAEVEYLWVAEDGTPFIPKNFHFAVNYANGTKQKLYKILKNG